MKLVRKLLGVSCFAHVRSRITSRVGPKELFLATMK